MDSLNQRFNLSTKVVDQKIKASVEEELTRMEMLTDVPQYQNQIRDRKSGISNIFMDFDTNMDILDERKRYSQAKSEPRVEIHVLDTTMGKRLFDKIDKIYKGTSIHCQDSTTIELHRALTQILDRQVRLRSLLDNYEENMQIIKTFGEVDSDKERA